jgi:hypothetical protein
VVREAPPSRLGDASARDGHAPTVGIMPE